MISSGPLLVVPAVSQHVLSTRFVCCRSVTSTLFLICLVLISLPRKGLLSPTSKRTLSFSSPQNILHLQKFWNRSTPMCRIVPNNLPDHPARIRPPHNPPQTFPTLDADHFSSISAVPRLPTSTTAPGFPGSYCISISLPAVASLFTTSVRYVGFCWFSFAGGGGPGPSQSGLYSVSSRSMPGRNRRDLGGRAWCEPGGPSSEESSSGSIQATLFAGDCSKSFFVSSFATSPFATTGTTAFLK